MNVKPHIFIFILILTFLGVASQQQESVVNQELVLNFEDVQITSQEAQSTISTVKDELELLGVDNIQVKSENQGKLIITYYSHVDVVSLKKILSEKQNLKLQYPQDNQQIPSGDKQIGYDFDIYEINNGYDLDSGFDRCILVEKSQNERYIDPNTFLTTTIINVRNDNTLKETLHIWKYIEASISNLSYAFPEVRAGPFA